MSDSHVNPLTLVRAFAITAHNLLKERFKFSPGILGARIFLKPLLSSSECLCHLLFTWRMRFQYSFLSWLLKKPANRWLCPAWQRGSNGLMVVGQTWRANTVGNLGYAPFHFPVVQFASLISVSVLHHLTLKNIIASCQEWENLSDIPIDRVGFCVIGNLDEQRLRWCLALPWSFQNRSNSFWSSFAQVY